MMRTVPAALRGRASWMHDDDEEQTMYQMPSGPVMYSNYYGVGPPTQPMSVIRENPFNPSSAAAAYYVAARSSSDSPSPKQYTDTLPVAPSAGGSGGSKRARSNSVSPAPTSANHGNNTTSLGHAPPSYTYHTPGSSGNASGSGGSSMPSLPTVNAPVTRQASPPLESMYPASYGNYVGQPTDDVGYAYEPEPIDHTREIMAGMSGLPYSQSEAQLWSQPQQPRQEHVRFASDIQSTRSRSLYSQDATTEWDEHERETGQDSRLDPLMRMQGGLVSQASMGPRDHEDYMRRVGVGVSTFLNYTQIWRFADGLFFFPLSH